MSAIFMFILIAIGFIALRLLIKYLRNTGKPEMATALNSLDELTQNIQDKIVKKSKEKFEETMKNVIGQTESMFDEGMEKIISHVFGLSGESSLFSKMSDHVFVITDDPVQPFRITKEIANKVSQLVINTKSKEDKAKVIFDWFVMNIKYDHDKCFAIEKGKSIIYSHSEEVFKNGLGVCGEMAILYVVMVRYVGISSHYSLVSIDCYGKTVNHACAAIKINGQEILVDPAFATFDVKHKKYQVLNDMDAVNHFKCVRGRRE